MKRDVSELCETAHDAIDSVDAIVITNEWQKVIGPAFPIVNGEFAEKVEFDGRNFFEPDMLEASGFEFHTIGRGQA